MFWKKKKKDLGQSLNCIAEIHRIPAYLVLYSLFLVGLPPELSDLFRSTLKLFLLSPGSTTL